MRKRGPKANDYETSWNEKIEGLIHQKDGRWRILATGYRFTESNENRAVEKAKKLLGILNTETLVAAPATAVIGQLKNYKQLVESHVTHDLLNCTGDELEIEGNKDEPGEVMFGVKIPDRILWPWLSKQLHERPEWIGEKTGIPELTSLHRFHLPKSAVKITAVIEAYKQKSDASKQAKARAIGHFQQLVDFCQAKTLDDFSEPQLVKFRSYITSCKSLKSSGTINGYLNKCRNVLSIARRGDLDVAQIDATLGRMRAKLYAVANNVEDAPHPISRENFHKLLDKVHETMVPEQWRAMLMVSLNCALYMEELLDIQWNMFDFDRRTFIARRKKKGRCIRVAMLFDKTIEALRAVPRRGYSPYVFTSQHGTRFSRNSKINLFKRWTDKIGMIGVTWSHIRDGAYSAACNHPEVAEKFARLLAGHKADGLQDKYVIRNPQIVKPACDAVYQKYFCAQIAPAT